MDIIGPSMMNCEGFNDQNDELLANLPNGESNTNKVDILSNGFKLRNTSPDVNGGSMLFAAFARNPFKLNGGLAR